MWVCWTKVRGHVMFDSVREDVLCSVSHFVQVGETGILYHGGWTTQDHQDLRGRSRKVVPDHVLVDEA